jgi:hypothetical protein
MKILENSILKWNGSVSFCSFFPDLAFNLVE